MQFLKSVLLICAFAVITGVLQCANGQETEQAPEKLFQYNIEYEGLKTDIIANEILNEILNLPGIENADMHWPDYYLTFEITNHALKKHDALGNIKQIFQQYGVSIKHHRKQEISR
jgi:hypothetical protein